MSKEPVKPINIWCCETCKVNDLSHKQMIEHLQKAHNLVTEGLRVNKRMVLHVDAADSYSSSYEVDIPDHPDIKLTNFTCNPRQTWRERMKAS